MSELGFIKTQKLGYLGKLNPTTAETTPKSLPGYRNMSRCLACVHRCGIVARVYEMRFSKYDGHEIKWVEKVLALMTRFDRNTCEQFTIAKEEFASPDDENTYDGNQGEKHDPLCIRFYCNFPPSKKTKIPEAALETLAYDIIDREDKPTLLDGKLMDFINESSMNQVELLSLYYKKIKDEYILKQRFIEGGYTSKHNKGKTMKTTLRVIMNTLCDMYNTLSDTDKEKVAIMLTLNKHKWTFGAKLLWYLLNHWKYRCDIAIAAVESVKVIADNYKGESYTEEHPTCGYNDSINSSWNGFDNDEDEEEEDSINVYYADEEEIEHVSVTNGVVYHSYEVEV